MNAINIISFDVPYPPNYGGIIDVFYKIKYFHNKGIKVHLHCYEYGRGKQIELEKYCHSVHYYKRQTGLKAFFSSIPYIVNSRNSAELKNNLLSNNYPILFEGLHSTFLLNDSEFKNRIKIFRESNIEHNYYRHLASAEKNILKKLYFLSETKKLKNYEPIIQKADISLIVSLKDLEYFKNKYKNSNFIFAPSFHPANEINIKKGLGKYILYHGNLSVAENIDAAKYIINLLKNINIPLIIAGLTPTKEVIYLATKNKIKLIQNPNDFEMQELIQNAQINFLYTNQATGLKLKLLNVLYNGRHCVVNSKMVDGTTLGQLCTVEDDADKLKSTIQSIFTKVFSMNQIELRKKVLNKDYSNENSLNIIMSAINKQ